MDTHSSTDICLGNTLPNGHGSWGKTLFEDAKKAYD